MRLAKCHPDLKHHAKGLCHICYQKQYIRTFPGARKRATQATRRWQARHGGMAYIRYGPTEAQYVSKVEDQNSRCAICGLPEIAKHKGRVIRLAVDHDHKTLIVRGLLCRECNTKLGSYEKLLCVPGFLHYKKTHGIL
jgi:hypothetical protein